MKFSGKQSILNQQQKKYVYFVQPLNGPVLKSLKTKRSGPKSEKKLAWLEPKFQFLFRAGPRLQPCRPAGPGPEKSGPRRFLS